MPHLFAPVKAEGRAPAGPLCMATGRCGFVTPGMRAVQGIAGASRLAHM